MAAPRFSIGVFAFFVSTVLVLGSSSHAASGRKTPLPGIQRGSAPLVSPQAARQILTWTHQDLGGGGPETEITPEIEELARGLRHDPRLIYEYVRNTIDYVPQYGSIRNATQTFLDRRGNDFDQAALMIALLRESGYTANFVYGVVRINAATISGMLGVASNANVVGGILASAGIPTTVFVNGVGALTFVEVDHVWVRVTIDGTDYDFAPSVKSYVRTTGINLATAMGYTQSAFLASATSGTTIDPNFIQNVHHDNLKAQFTTFSTNLSAEVRSMAGPKLKDVVGGKEIVQLRNQAFVTTLPNEIARDFEWIDVPSTFQTTLSVQHLGIDEDLPVASVYGKRLTISYNGSGAPELRIDGSLVATGSVVSPGSFNNITLTADHPYAAFGGTYGDQTITRAIEAGGTYVLVNGWAEPGRDVVDKHKKIALANAASNPQGSEPVLGESLTIVALTWLGEAAAAINLADDVGLTTTIQHHTVGFCGQNDSPFIDLPLGFVSVISNTNTPADEDASFFVGSGISSALEWGVFDQVQEVSAVCTVKLVDISSDKGDKIFNATSANFGTISPQLVGYSAGEVALVQSYTNAGYRVILPQDGNLGEGDWTGVGFLAISPDESQIGHIISGGLSGGEGIFVYLLDPAFAGESGYLGFDPFGHEMSFEPIDLVKGDYVLDTQDLSLGNGELPFKLDFARHYSSGARERDGALGLGWTHNFHHVLRGTDSDGFKGLGEESPLDAVPGIVELYVALDLLNGTKTLERLVLGTVAHRWFMDRLIDNVVVFEDGATTNRYVKMPDGTFEAPPGSADVLTLEGDDSYRIERKHGVTIDFDVDGKIESWSDRSANTVSYFYDGDELEEVSTSMGRSLTFTRTSGRITEIDDSGGRSVQYQYDVDGNLTSYTDAESHTTTYEYDDPGRLTQIFYPANPIDPFVTNEYDPFHRVMTQTDANDNEWEYFYAGTRTEEEDPLGNSKAWHFDVLGHTTLEIDALGNETVHVYDGQGRRTKSTYPELNAIVRAYDARHNETQVTLQPKPGSGQTNTVKSFTYESSFDFLESMTDQLGRETTYEYDAGGNLQTKTQPKVDGETPVTSYTYNARGQVLTETDPEGMVTAYTYDPASGDLLSIVLDDSGLALTSTRTYDDVGNVLTTTNPLGHTTTMTYDDRRLIDAVTSPAPFSHLLNYDYDANGRLVLDERETGILATPWQTTEYTYTLSGKKETMTNPEKHVSTWEYDALDRVSRFIDAELNDVEFTYDAAGRLDRVINALGHEQEEFTWHPNGQKASVRDAKNNLSTFTYDGFDKLRRETYADASFEQYTYDAVGNMLTKRVRSGVTITHTYDALDRIRTKQVPGGAPASVQYEYDQVGRLVDATDVSGATHHDYDSAGRLTAVTRPDSQSVGYQYDAASQRTRVTHPDGYFATYEYDELGRLTDVRENGASLIVHYDYDALDRRTDASFGNGTSTAYTREIDNNVTAIEHTLSGSSVDLAYTYDLVGNRLTRTDSSGLSTFTYDADYRLTGIVQPGDDVSYTYDPAGNRITETVGAATTSYTTNALNQYTSVGSANLTYDANGNQTTDGSLRYAFDAENRLRRVYAATFAVDYQHDVFGRRIGKKRTAGPMVLPQSHTQHPLITPHPDVESRTSYVYDGNQVILERDGETGTVLRRFVYGTYVDEPVLMKQASGDAYFHSDAVGSVVALSNASGVAIDTFAYTPYGAVDAVGASGNPYFFTGRELDAETGLYFYRARYYDPRTGRFLSPDPIRFAGGPNFYAYAANSPLMYIDPLGLDWLTNLSNFSAGFGDSLTFGLTGVVRGWMGVDDVVDRNSGWYQAGEYTEVAVEVTLTLGSAALKQGAKHASREVVRAEYRAATRHIAREGKELHHIQPLFGHPGGAPTLFPTGGLPAWIHSSRWNTQLLDHASHMAAHRYLRMLENGAVIVVNPLTTGLRGLLLFK